MKADFSQLLTGYLLHYLPEHLGASANTIISYRDAFSLFLQYCRSERAMRPEKMTLDMLNRELVLGFLLWLEEKRRCTTSTRNQRLAVLHAFSRYVQMESPEHALTVQQILAIPCKRTKQPTISYLSLEDMKRLLSQPDMRTATGRRNAALLSLLYDSGARVQELADSCVGDLRVSSPACIRLTGKGNKSRTVPLMPATVALLKAYLREYRLDSSGYESYPLFFNRDGQKLSRAGIQYILSKYAQMSLAHCESFPDKLSPHCLRHSKAMHLLQAGVNLIYIRDILGHVDIKTTEIYARADAEMKRAAIEAVQPDIPPSSLPHWQEDDALMRWLHDFCRYLVM